MRQIVFFVLGLAMLGFGGFRQISGRAVGPADQTRCEREMQEESATTAEVLALLLSKCDAPGRVGLSDARSAAEGAQARSAVVSQSDSLAHLTDWALIGGGIAALAGAALPRRRAA